jgi:hypothetical protein
MERRGFLGMLAAVVAVGSARPDAETETTFGYLTPEIVRARGYDNGSVRVYLDGRELTSRTPRETIMACDDRAGYVELLARDWRHRLFTDPFTGKLARERRYGLVRVSMQRPS